MANLNAPRGGPVTPKAGIDARAANGPQKSRATITIYIGEEGHSCIRKAAELLGIGSNHIRVIRLMYYMWNELPAGWKRLSRLILGIALFGQSR